MMDAAEIAGLECSFQCDGLLSHSETEQLIRGTKSILDALEQAQKERDKFRIDAEQLRLAYDTLNIERDAARQFAKDARAMLGDADEVLAKFWVHGRTAALRARIEAMLEQKP